MAIVDFFLGTITSDGYFSLFEQSVKPPVESFLLKGTPSSGKSTIMKKICSNFSDQNKTVEQIHCSQCPDSLDGLIYPEQQVSILDATDPHSFDPVYPIVAGTEISLYDCVNANRIYHQSEQVIKSVDQMKIASVRCKNFLHAMQSLLEENRNIAVEYTDLEKIQRLAKRLRLKEMPKQNKQPVEHKRLLSAVTPDGMITYENTVQKLCSRIYIIKDEHTFASSILLSMLRLHALESGQEFYTCYYPFEISGKIEHLIFPKLDIAFVTSHRYNEISFQPYRTINYSRFTNMSGLKQHKQRLAFHRKAADELFREAVDLLKYQRDQHNRLESIYTNATDYDCVNIITAKLVNNLDSKL